MSKFEKANGAGFIGLFIYLQFFFCFSLVDYDSILFPTGRVYVMLEVTSLRTATICKALMHYLPSLYGTTIAQSIFFFLTAGERKATKILACFISFHAMLSVSS